MAKRKKSSSAWGKKRLPRVPSNKAASSARPKKRSSAHKPSRRQERPKGKAVPAQEERSATLSDLELENVLRLSDKAGFDDPWLLSNRARCFLCGMPLKQEIQTKEHLIPGWLIRRYKLNQKQGRGKAARYPHAFRFAPDWEVPYPDLTVHACHNCNCGYLHSVEHQIKRMFKLPMNRQSIDCGWPLAFWLGKIVWGLQWYLMMRLKEHGEVELIHQRWKATRVLRVCLNVLRHTTTLAAGSRPVSVFLYNCQKPPRLEEQFDWQVNLTLNAVWMRIDGLVAVMSFDFGWQTHWQANYFDRFVHRDLHPWPAEQIGALFFNAAGCRPQIPTNLSVPSSDQISVHVLDPGVFRPLKQDTEQLLELLATFQRRPVEAIRRPDGGFHNLLVAPDGGEQYISIDEYPWRGEQKGC